MTWIYYTPILPDIPQQESADEADSCSSQTMQSEESLVRLVPQELAVLASCEA
jgi:hypothetical protein